MSEWQLLAVAATGAIAGGLSNRCIDRLPSGQPLFFRRDPCPLCGRADGILPATLFALSILGPNAPLRCSRCRTTWRPTQSVVAALMPIVWIALALRHGFQPRSAALVVFVTSLIILAVIDYEHYLLPDVVTLPMTGAGVAATAIPGWPITLMESCLSAAAGYFGMMALAKVAEQYYGEEALGQGDWKMVAMIGAYFGSTKLMLVLVGANAAGAVIGLGLIALRGAEGRQKLPLGSFLGLTALLVAFL